MGKGNPQNLIPNSERSPEELREQTRKGGIASGEARRYKKSLREIARAMLETELLDGDDLKVELEKRGIDPSMGHAMMFAQLARANKGDTEAARFVRDTSGQRPADQLEVGNLDGKPFESLDLSKLSDAELRLLMESRGGE